MLKNQTVDCRSVTMEAIITFLFVISTKISSRERLLMEIGVTFSKVPP